jgi:hypothetical protein
MTVSVELLHFLKTGEFGPVRLGMSDAEVTAALGQPDCRTRAVNREKAPSIWLYDPFELYFDSETGSRLEAIFTDHIEEIAECTRLRVDVWILRRGLALEQAEFRLEQEGIDFATSPCPWNKGNAVDLTVASGVKLSFQVRREYDEDHLGLYSISLRSDRPATPEVRQVSVSLSPELYERARRAALREKISIARALRRLIERHADELDGE